jgi:hypothetical protein
MTAVRSPQSLAWSPRLELVGSSRTRARAKSCRCHVAVPPPCRRRRHHASLRPWTCARRAGARSGRRSPCQPSARARRWRSATVRRPGRARTSVSPGSGDICLYDTGVRCSPDPSHVASSMSHCGQLSTRTLENSSWRTCQPAGREHHRSRWAWVCDDAVPTSARSAAPLPASRYLDRAACIGRPGLLLSGKGNILPRGACARASGQRIDRARRGRGGEEAARRRRGGGEEAAARRGGRRRGEVAGGEARRRRRERRRRGRPILSSRTASSLVLESSPYVARGAARHRGRCPGRRLLAPRRAGAR